MQEQVAFIISQSVCATIEMEAMKAMNQEREHKGESQAYGEQAFLDLITKYEIGYNEVMSRLYH